MSRKQPKRRAGMMAPKAVAGFFIFIVACGVGFGAASADSTDELARAGAFGFTQETHAATQGNAPDDGNTSPDDPVSSKPNVLAQTSERDITAGLAMVDEREAEERAQVQADNKAALKRVSAERDLQRDIMDDPSVAETALRNEMNRLGTEPKPGNGIDEYGLSPVDWTVGKYAFIAEWGDRIDTYLKGTVLEGYGTTFAEAAWRNGVDPRWSPAISNTESGNGAKCFLPHNAWGWGDETWPDWETAINEHVAGLAKGYGYSLTMACAKKYCPPNYAHWFKNTLGQMALI